MTRRSSSRRLTRVVSLCSPLTSFATSYSSGLHDRPNHRKSCMRTTGGHLTMTFGASRFVRAGCSAHGAIFSCSTSYLAAKAETFQ